jgi:alpha-1,6-mannosyltransferase
MVLVGFFQIMNWKTLKGCVIWGGITSVICIASTVLVDSQFWGRWLWPELEVLHFNTVQNKSHEWGVSPWHWYFLVALPKSVTISVPLIFLGIIHHDGPSFFDYKLIKLMLPALIFVGLYSFLPHKELRFIFPALTIFNIGGAIGLGTV